MIGNMKTPETDALYERLLAENPGNLIYLEEMLELACRLERERDEALMDRNDGDIATMTRNHYERLIKERDEAKADAAALADKLSGLELRSTEELARLERERDEAREALRELWQTADAYIPQIDEEQTTKWHNAMFGNSKNG
jgi:hypothetical protein